MENFLLFLKESKPIFILCLFIYIIIEIIKNILGIWFPENVWLYSDALDYLKYFSVVLWFVSYKLTKSEVFKFDKNFDFFQNSHKAFMHEKNQISDPLALNAFETPIGQFIKHNYDLFNQTGKQYSSETLKSLAILNGLVILGFVLNVFDFSFLMHLNSTSDGSVFLYSMIDIGLILYPIMFFQLVFFVSHFKNFRNLKELEQNYYSNFTRIQKAKNRNFNEIEARQEIIDWYGVANPNEIQNLIYESN